MNTPNSLAGARHAPVSSSARARRLLVEMLYNAGEGHYGGSLSVIDILDALAGGWVRDSAGDRLVLSKGHAAAALYAVWASQGRLPVAELSTFGQYGSRLQGHPDSVLFPSVDFSTGSLGQGISGAVGFALAAQNTGARSFVVLGDGECQEGQVWEAAMLASRLRLRDLVAIVDLNRRQEWGFRTGGGVADPLPSPAEKWSAFGWAVIHCDGHDADALNSAIGVALAAKGPAVILAKTTKGYGTSLISDDPDRFHCAGLTVDEYEAVLGQLA